MTGNNKHINKKRTSELSEDTGFSVPKGYFDSVEEIFSSKLTEETFPNENGFKIPEDYLNTIEDKIISQLDFPKKGKVISLRKRIIRFMPAAAVITIFLFLGINFMFTTETELTSDEIDLWFDDNINSISNEELFAAYDNFDLDDSKLVDNIINQENIDSFVNENDAYLLLQESDIDLNELD